MENNEQKILFRISIPGNPITKKNSQQIIRINGQPRLIPSKNYRLYEKLAGVYIAPQKPLEPIAGPVTVTCTYYMETRRHVDLTNLLEATDDILVKCGVLQDDNRDVIASHDGSRVYHDPEKPRVEILITGYAESYPLWREARKAPVKRATGQKKKAPAPLIDGFDEEHWD